MKNLMMIGSALLVLSSSAFATEARLLALGMKETDNDGMYYVQDSRNIFLNSAYVNNYADQLVMEYGGAGRQLNVGQTASLDAVNNPKAQGGVFKKYGSLVYGLYFGNESNTSSLIRIAATTDTSSNRMLQTTDNQVDLFVAGEAAVKWGANLLFASGKDETKKSKDSAISTRFGAIGSNWDAHLNVSLRSKSEAESTTGIQESKGKLGVHVGGSYNLPNGKVFGYVKTYGWDQVNTGASTYKGDFTSYYLGWGNEMAVNNGDKLFASLAARKVDINVKYANKAEVRNLLIPLTLGYEAKANDWLTIRGSVIQNLYGMRDNKNITGGTSGLNTTAQSLVSGIYGGNGKTTIANSTEVNAGATLVFGNVSFDGLIGTTAAARNGDIATTTGTNKGVLALDNLQSKVAMTYKF